MKMEEEMEWGTTRRGAAETQAGQRRRVTNVHATQKGRLGDSSKGDRG